MGFRAIPSLYPDWVTHNLESGETPIVKKYQECYQAFIRKLRQARIEAGLTQAQVAAILDKPQSYVSKCERGKRRVDPVELVEFILIYEKPIAYFLELDL